MLSSSKSEAKQDARLAARIDVLRERVDTLASTVATTASAIAKKDGEIASLRRDLDSRDETLRALVAQARTPPAAAGGPAVDAQELRSLKNAVAALIKERAESRNTLQAEELTAQLRALEARVQALSATVSAAAESDRRSDELRSMLAALRSQVDALGGITTGVGEDRVERRFAETDGVLETLSGRVDSLAATVESAAASLGEKERELADLHRQFTDSSTRVESIVEDIRAALHAFPELSSTSLDHLAARVERIEAVSRETASARERGSAELVRRIDVVEQRVAAVADEVARAKTLWPVALRSLEARLDDAVHPRRRNDATAQTPAADTPSDDLLAGLRDSLDAMETVAAEMARASEALNDAVEDATPHPEDRPEPPQRAEPPPAVAAGATVVPLRVGEP